ncbi:MAG: 4Fe-4S binding protein [Thermodesulfobacteriota bacterium]
MRITTARRVSQGFFLALFLWFCVVSTLGERYWQLRGWPVNWFLDLDPLAALGSLIASGSLYAGMAWALLTIALTMLLGRFFCGWLCPFGSMHHFLGWLGRRGKGAKASHALNQPHPAQAVKYYVLLFMLAGAGAELLPRLAAGAGWWLVLAVIIAVAVLAARRLAGDPKRAVLLGLAWAGLLAGLALWSAPDEVKGASLQTGLLDPIPLAQRSVNLVLLPLIDAAAGRIAVAPRLYQGAGLIAAIFLAALLMNFWRPRFFCRFVCPAGALMGLLGRWALLRVGRTQEKCRACGQCETDCEGACAPFAGLRQSECVLCMNCLNACRDGLVTYAPVRSAGGEAPSPDIGRRGVVLSLVSGVAAVPALRLGGLVGPAWSPGLIRPPGALAEPLFLERCLKCGQCMRVCPTNVIQPAGWEHGLEALWTPGLNMRIGTSGCQLNCVACGQICPTAAIRPISLAEKRGLGDFAAAGPVRLGTAFVDRGRCLPWAMDRPCIVCQENCPVSPKAITVHEHYAPRLTARVGMTDGKQVELNPGGLKPGSLATGDYFLQPAERPDQRRRIKANTEDGVTLYAGGQWRPAGGEAVEVAVRLQQPLVDPARCIGCGVCEHECPVSGQRAIRVTAENESRSAKRSLLL